MKNFMMRGVVFAALLSSLIFPASAAFSNTDSTNIANIKTYTYDIKTALTSGTLFTNISAIKTSVSNISSSVSSIYTQIQATNNHLSTNNTKTDTGNGYLKNIQDYIGTSTTYKTVNGLLQNLLTKQTSIDMSVGSIKTSTSSISSKLDSTNSTLGDIKTGTDYLSGISAKVLKGGWATELMQNNIYNKISGFATEDTVSKLGTEETLSLIDRSLDSVEARVDELSNYLQPTFYSSKFAENLDDEYFDVDSSCIFTLIAGQLSEEYYARVNVPMGTDVRTKTVFSHLKNLSETLASDQDKAIRDLQDDNVSQVQQDFVSGSSSGTSLGKSDFGSLSSVGSTAKDIASLNGQASVGSFTDGLTAADTQGQGWFSETTRAALDAVTSPAAEISLDDSDPYNMGNFAENYIWVFGGAGR